LKEAAALEKLTLPSEIHGTVENTMVENSNTLKVPDNNPFKKRKCDETQFVQIESIAEEVLVATDENLEILCLTTPDNTPLEVLDKSARKRSLSDIHSDQIVEQVSGITEVEDSDILYINLESQGSVNSKPKKATDGKRRGKTEKSKRSNSKISENKKSSSILNFFSRV
jgi:exonuclease-1